MCHKFIGNTASVQVKRLVTADLFGYWFIYFALIHSETVTGAGKGEGR